MKIEIACLLAVGIAAVQDVPQVPQQWKSNATQTMAGNIPGIQPGTTKFVSYYDYPNRHRYQYDTQDIIYMF